MTLNDLAKQILAILPNATFGEDNDGQIVIYTDKHADGKDETLIDFVVE